MTHREHRGKWPIVRYHEVTHVGTLLKQHVGQGGSLHGKSHHGQNLSVSLNPEFWREAAELGDAPCWTIQHSTGEFLDARTLLSCPPLKRALLSWGERHHLIDVLDRVSAWTFDTEASVWLMTLYADEEQARTAMIEELEEQDDGAAPERLSMLRTRAYHQFTNDERAARHFPHVVSTPVKAGELEQRSGFILHHEEDAFWALLSAVAGALNLQGVWYDDPTNRATRTAPQGLIRTDRLDQWTVKKVTPWHDKAS